MKSPSQSSREAMTARVAIEPPHIDYEKFGEIVGFLDGDGSVIERNTEVSFYNCDLNCVRRTLDNFEAVFGVGRGRFHYYLTIPFGKNSEKIRKVWERHLVVQKRIKTHIDERGRIKKRFGGMKCSLHNAGISKKIRNKWERLRLGMEENRKFLRGYLRGFFAAEGAVIPGKERRVIPNSIQFPQKGRETPDMIKKILGGFGIEGRVVLKQKKADYYCVNITGYENFRRFYELGLSDMHPEKKEKIKKGLESYGRIVARKLVLPARLLRALEKQSMTRSDIYTLMEAYPQKINGMLYSRNSYLVKNKLIRKTKRENGDVYWSITRRGHGFLHKQE